MNITLKTLSKKEAQSFVLHNSDITYADEFFLFQEKRYGTHGEFVGIEQDKEIIAIIPVNFFLGKEAFSVYKDYTKPYFIAKNAIINWQEVVELLKKKFGAYYAELHFAEVEGKRTPLSAFILNLSDGQTQEQREALYHKKTRNEVRKSEKFNFITRVGGLELLDEFYQLYQKNMKRHGTPERSIDFFRDFFAHYQEKCKIIAVFDNDIHIGANFVLIHNAYLRIVFNVSDVAYWKKCVNNFLYNKTISLGYKDGIRVFDFGPSLNKDASHNKFKLGFGATQIPLVKFTAGSPWQTMKKWFERKQHSLKLRTRKIFPNL